MENVSLPKYPQVHLPLSLSSALKLASGALFTHIIFPLPPFHPQGISVNTELELAQCPPQHPLSVMESLSYSLWPCDLPSCNDPPSLRHGHSCLKSNDWIKGLISSVLAWRIPRTEDPGGLQSMESQVWR